MPTLPRLRAPRERIIREELARWVTRRLGPGTTIVHELGIKHGDFRVDVCAIARTLHGYEIKSDEDTLARLPSQAKQFSLVFQRMTLVVGPALLAPALSIVPGWWGIVLVSLDAAGDTQFVELREPQQNPKPNHRWVARLLWRDEITACLKARGIRGYSKLKYWQIANLLLEAFTPDEITERVCDALRLRKGPGPAPDAQAPVDTDSGAWCDDGPWGADAWGHGACYA